MGSTKVEGKEWRELSKPQKAMAVFSALAKLLWGLAKAALFVVTITDIRQRPAEQIKGDKRLWTALAFAGPLGQVAYFVLGRKTDD